MKSPSVHTIVSLDGVRGLAIILVVWCHLTTFGGTQRGMDVGPAPLRAIGDFGFVGVFLFFVLSGFLLFLPYARAILAGAAWPSVRSFYLRRMLRILPAYYVALFIMVMLHRLVAVQPSHLTAFTFLLLLLQDWWKAASDLSFQLDGPFWTLTVEWQFYLLLPWLALALAWFSGWQSGRVKWWRLIGGLSLVVLVGLSLRLLAALFYYQSDGIFPYDAPGLMGILMKGFYGTRGRYLEVFALGIGGSLVYVWGIEQRNLSRRRSHLLGSMAVLISIIGLTTCIGWTLQAQRIPPNQFDPTNGTFVPPGGWAWQVVGEWVTGCCFLLLVLGVVLGPSAVRWIFERRGIRFLGKISYSLYLWHFPILAILSAAAPSSVPFAYLRFVLSGILVILLVSVASYYGIERPFLRWRRTAPLSIRPATLEVKG